MKKVLKRFDNRFQSLTQAIYSSGRTKKIYEILVREVLNAEDASIDQKYILRIVALVKLVVLSIEYIYELNHRTTDIAYGIVAIIKKTRNYRNDQSAVNTYYQALRELKKLNKANTASETTSVTESSKRTFTLDCTWYNIKNFWKVKKKVKPEETEELKKQFYTSPPPSLTEDLFKEVLFKSVFNPSKLGEGLLEFSKRKDKRMLRKNLA